VSAREAVLETDRTPGSLRTILSAGILAGALDITAAFVVYGAKGASPKRILQGISSGLLGPAAFRGGWKTVVLGGAFQFFIAVASAAVFFAASRSLAALVRRPLLWGALYGIAVYVVMYRIVVPLSRFHSRPFSWSATATAVVIHVFCVGIPIAAMVARGARPRG
jgi:hypothetical protein